MKNLRLTLSSVLLIMFASACQPVTDISITQTAIVMARMSIELEQTSIAIEETKLELTQKSSPAEAQPATPSIIAPQPIATPIPEFTEAVQMESPSQATLGAESICKVVYRDAGSTALNSYYPEGWMGTGNGRSITMDENYRLDPDREKNIHRASVIQIKYNATEDWTGIYWWNPAGYNWCNGEKNGGFDLSACAKRMVFWARGENGGERAEFKVGGLVPNNCPTSATDSMTSPVSTGILTLSREWQEYTIDLSGQDLSRVFGGFIWVTNKDSNPDGATIFLDDIMYMK